MSSEHPSLRTDLRTYVRLLRELRALWGAIAAVAVLSLLSAPLALLVPLPLKIAIDTAIDHRPLPRLLAATLPRSLQQPDAAVLTLIAGLVITIAFADQLRGLAADWLTSWTGERMLLDFRARLFGHVQRLSFSYHDSRGTADSLYRIQNDTYSFQYILLQATMPLLAAVVTLGGMIYVMARLNWRLAAVAVAVCPALMLITSVSRRRLREGWDDAKRHESGVISVVQEVLGALRVVQAFAQEQREQERFVKASDRGRQVRLRIALLEGLSKSLLALTIATGTALVLFMGVRLVQDGELSKGDLILAMGYLAQLYVPVQIISTTLTDMQGGLASGARVFAVLDEVPDVTEKPHARPLVRAAGAVAFRNVSFAYENGKPVLRDVSLELSPGMRLGIRGVTGAGKTTLMNLLSRFYDPTEGAILLDGVDLRDYRLTDLRRQFAIVLQEPVLFSTTIAENIAYARPNATPDQVIRAAQAAHAHDFISQLPAGYETLVGERGMRLSGGERQRISLARAFLKDAPILILDEPTSSVDVKTEALIMQAMEELMRGRTSIMIAHRLSTLGHCDSILEIEDGRVTPASASPAALEAGMR
jgi:ATP-binding cassette subfamily B protein